MTPPKTRRPENRALPARWRFRYGAYYYQVPPGARDQWDGKAEFRLGKTLAEAHRTFAARMAPSGELLTMEQMLDRYSLEVVPTKAPATQRSNQYSLRRLRAAFAGNPIAAIRPKHIYQYRDHIGRTESKKKANLDLELLSHAFTCAIRWGAIDEHPMTNKRVEKFSLAHRRVAVDPGDLVRFAGTLPRKWQLFITLLLWTGRRKGELLRLRRQDLLEEGLRFENNKREGDEFILAWEEPIRAAVRELLTLGESVGSVYLFHTRDGQPYIKADGTTSGLDSIWQRHMAAAVRKGTVRQRFTIHDLRKVRASDLSADQARALLRHTNQRMTDRYRVKPTVVKIGS